MSTKSIQTVIDQKDCDGIFGVIDNITGRYLVLFGSDITLRIANFEWIVYSKGDIDIMKIHRDDIIYFINTEFEGNRRLANVLVKMMRLKTCNTAGKAGNMKAANQPLYLS